MASAPSNTRGKGPRISSLSSLSSTETDLTLPAGTESRDTNSTSTGTAISDFFSSTNVRRRAVSWKLTERPSDSKRQRTSWIYKHGSEVEQENGDGTRYWKCNLCNQEPYKAKATSAMEYHLRLNHRLHPGTSPSSSPALSVMEQQRIGAEIQAAHDQQALSFEDRLVR